MTDPTKGTSFQAFADTFKDFSDARKQVGRSAFGAKISYWMGRSEHQSRTAAAQAILTEYQKFAGKSGDSLDNVVFTTLTRGDMSALLTKKPKLAKQLHGIFKALEKSTSKQHLPQIHQAAKDSVKAYKKAKNALDALSLDKFNRLESAGVTFADLPAKAFEEMSSAGLKEIFELASEGEKQDMLAKVSSNQLQHFELGKVVDHLKGMPALQRTELMGRLVEENIDLADRIQEKLLEDKQYQNTFENPVAELTDELRSCAPKLEIEKGSKTEDGLSISCHAWNLGGEENEPPAVGGVAKDLSIGKSLTVAGKPVVIATAVDPSGHRWTGKNAQALSVLSRDQVLLPAANKGYNAVRALNSKTLSANSAVTAFTNAYSSHVKTKGDFVSKAINEHRESQDKQELTSGTSGKSLTIAIVDGKMAIASKSSADGVVIVFDQSKQQATLLTDGDIGSVVDVSSGDGVLVATDMVLDGLIEKPLQELAEAMSKDPQVKEDLNKRASIVQTTLTKPGPYGLGQKFTNYLESYIGLSKYQTRQEYLGELVAGLESAIKTPSSKDESKQTLIEKFPDKKEEIENKFASSELEKELESTKKTKAMEESFGSNMEETFSQFEAELTPLFGETTIASVKAEAEAQIKAHPDMIPKSLSNLFRVKFSDTKEGQVQVKQENSQEFKDLENAKIGQLDVSTAHRRTPMLGICIASYVMKVFKDAEKEARKSGESDENCVEAGKLAAQSCIKNLQKEDATEYQNFKNHLNDQNEKKTKLGTRSATSGAINLDFLKSQSSSAIPHLEKVFGQVALNDILANNKQAGSPQQQAGNIFKSAANAVKAHRLLYCVDDGRGHLVTVP